MLIGSGFWFLNETHFSPPHDDDCVLPLPCFLVQTKKLFLIILINYENRKNQLRRRSMWNDCGVISTSYFFGCSHNCSLSIVCRCFLSVLFSRLQALAASLLTFFSSSRVTVAASSSIVLKLRA